MARGRFVALGILIAVAAGCRSTNDEAIDVSYNLLVSGADRDVQEGQYDLAIRKLERAAALRPEEPEPPFRLGNTLVKRALRPDVDAETRRAFITRALAQHEVARRKAPRQALYQYAVGRDYVLLERPTDALPPLELARALAPDIPYIDARFGDAYRQMKDYPKALEFYRSGLTKPQERLATTELHEGIGETYAAQGQIDEAVKELDLARQSAGREHAKRLAQRIEALKAPASRPAP